MRWNTRDAWIVSPAVTHEAVIDEDTFRKAQTAIEEQGRRNADPGAPRARRRSSRPYLLRGVITCGRCDRHMEGSWNNERPHYRCKLKPADVALATKGRPKSVYVREDKIVLHVDLWLDHLFFQHAVGKRSISCGKAARMRR